MKAIEYEIAQIAIEKIELNPVFAMRELKQVDVDTLAKSIKEQGLINPLLVRRLLQKSGNTFELISGHRRLMALKALRSETASCHVVDVDDAKAFVLALSENLERKDPDPMEEAQAFQRAIQDLKMTPEDVAKRVNRPVAFIYTRLGLLKLIPEVQAALKEGKITIGAADQGFVKLKAPEDQLELLKDIKRQSQGGGTVNQGYVNSQVHNLNTQRARAENLKNYLKNLGDKLKFPVCPKCKKAPDPGAHQMELNKHLVSCGNWQCSPWNPESGVPRRGQTDLEGNIRGSVKGGENAVKVEAKGHRSELTALQFFNHLAALIKKSGTLEEFQLQRSIGKDLEFTVQMKAPWAMDWPEGTFETKEYKNSVYRSFVSLKEGWGGANNETIKDRERLWKIEKAIDPKINPAEIVRVPLERLVINHKALAKGTVLKTKKGDWTIHTVHRDYTAKVQHPEGEVALLEEPELRKLVKEAQGKGGGGIQGATKASPKVKYDGAAMDHLGHHFLRFDSQATGAKPGAKAWECENCGLTCTGDVKKLEVKCSKTKNAVKGKCSKCGCTENTPCVDESGDPCSWVDDKQMLCSACEDKEG